MKPSIDSSGEGGSLGESNVKPRQGAFKRRSMSPFDKDYKSDISMVEVDKNNQRGRGVSKHITKQRQKNPMFGTLYGIGELVVDKKIVDEPIGEKHGS